MATAPQPWRPAAPPRPGAKEKPKASAIDADALVNRLRELTAGSNPPLDALEQSLHAVLEASGAAAGAICLYDTRQQLLRLVAEQGLSDEGCRQLRTVRRGDATSWDMPLHGLVNRRVYLVDNAANNRYVPPLVDGTVQTIACLPLYSRNTPQGSLVVLMVAPARLHEDDIRALDQPMRELGGLIELVRRQVSGDAVPSREVTKAPVETTAHPTEPPPPAPATTDQVTALTAELAAARREKARLEAQIERLRNDSTQTPQFTEMVAEVDRLRARLAEAEAGAAYAQRAREELQATLERGSSAEQNELREAIEAARRAEAMRSGLLAENARLAAEIERLRHSGSSAADAPDLLAELDRLRTKLAEAEAGAAHEHRVREELEAALQRGVSVGQTDLHEAHEATQRAEAARNALLAENTRLAQELDRLRSGEGGTSHPAPELAAEVDRLRARLAETAAGAAHEHRAREELEARIQNDQETLLQELHEGREAIRLARAAHTHVASENARLEAELAWARHEVDRIAPLLESLASAERDRSELATALEAARTERLDEQHAGAARESARAAEAAATIAQLQAQLAETERRVHDVQQQAAGTAGAQDEQLREAREQATVADAARHSALQELTVAKGSLSRTEAMLNAAQEDATRAREELARLRTDEGVLRGERDQIALELDAVRAREQDLAARLAERGREVEAIQQDREQENAQTDRLRRTVAALEMERRRLSAEVEGAAAARTQLEAALEQGLSEARAREQGLAEQLAERGQQLEALRADRAAEAARLEQLGSDADRLRQSVSELELERGRLTAEVEGAAAARARLEQALEQGHAEARAREQEITARLTEREHELEALRADRVAEAERVEQLGTEVDRLRQSVGDLELERGRLSAEVEGAAAARARLEESLEQGLADARTRERDLAARLAAREEEFAARLAARDEELAAGVQECAQVSSPTAPPAADGAFPEPASTEDLKDLTDADVKSVLAELAADLPVAAEATPPATPPAATPAAPSTPPDEAPAPAVGEGDPLLTVVLDTNPAWERSTGPKQKVTVVAVDANSARRVSELGPARVVANLTHPKVLPTLAAVREAGSRAQFWGSIADPATGRGFMLGLIESASRPLDPNAILALFEGHGIRGKRVLTVGDDIDGFISLRQALTRSGTSVSMAWNWKQAVDLIPMVRPQLVVLDLGVPGDAAPVLALLAAATPAPVTVLAAGTKDAAPLFAKALEGAASLSTLPGMLSKLQAPATAA